MTFEQIYSTYAKHREELDELAGKLEFDHGLTRENAEVETALRMHEKYLLFIQGTLFNGGRY